MLNEEDKKEKQKERKRIVAEAREIYREIMELGSD